MAQQPGANNVNAGALKRAELVRLLNQTQIADRRRRSKRDNVTTATTVRNWIDAGLPMNSNSTINLLEVCAWLACERKDSTSAAGKDIAAGRASTGKLKSDLMKSQVDALKASTEWRKIQSQLAEFKRRIQAGELVEASTIEKGDIEKAHFIREHLEDLSLYAPRLLNKRGKALRDELEKIAREICVKLAGDA